MQTPSYHVVDSIVNHYGDVCAAEAQGMLAGLLCAQPQTDAATWQGLLFDEAAESLSQADAAALYELFVETQGLLQTGDFSFDLFLPDEDEPLSRRAHALAGWCQGFLSGLVLADRAMEWSEDCAELLRDLADIARLDEDAVGEADESAYTEICEYVRVVAHTVQSELENPPNVKLH